MPKTAAELTAALDEAEAEVVALLKPLLTERYGSRGVRFVGILAGMSLEDTMLHTRSFGNLGGEVLREILTLARDGLVENLEPIP